VALAAKLQLKPAQTVAVADAPANFDGDDLGEHPEAALAQADLVLVFAPNGAQLAAKALDLVASARRGALTWVAYPKGGKLGTDLNRNTLRESVAEHGLDTVRQIALDDTWSALRLKAT
jgi:hypothetical protein